MTPLVISSIACTICLSNADSPLLDAARIGVLVMVAVTCGVLAAFGRWVATLARRSGDADRGNR
jgi:hypothetical protein